MKLLFVCAVLLALVVAQTPDQTTTTTKATTQAGAAAGSGSESATTDPATCAFFQGDEAVCNLPTVSHDVSQPGATRIAD